MQNAVDFSSLRRFVLITLSIYLSLVSVQSVSAVEYGGFGGRPAYPREGIQRTESIFLHTLEPGNIQNEGVMVENNTAEQVTMLVYGVDSTPSTGGAFACEQRAEVSDDVGAWIKLEKSEVVLEVGQKELIPFTISVPQSASVGEHNGCIIMQEKIVRPDEKSGMNLAFRTGLRVAITVPGELVRKLEILGFSIVKNKEGNFVLKPRVKNLGNVSIDASVIVTTRYFFGLLLQRNEGGYPILRNDTTDWNLELKKPFWGGWYRSDFVLEYDTNPEASVGVQSGKQLTRLVGPTVWFYSFPTPLALAIEIVVLLSLLGCLFLLWLAHKRKHWIKTAWVEYEVMHGDDINLLAERFDVSWKIIAKANKLKPPYILNAGEKLRVPPLK